MITRPFDVSVTFGEHDFKQRRTVQFTHSMPGHWNYARPLFESGIDTVAMLDKPAGYSKAPSGERSEAFLVYIVQGEMQVSVADRSTTVTSGMMAYLPNYFSTARYCPVNTWFTFVHLADDLAWAGLLHRGFYVRDCDYMDLLIPALGKMFQARELQTDVSQIEALENSRFIAELLRRELRYAAKDKSGLPAGELVKLISHIREHPEYGWTLTSMAGHVGTSKRSLGRQIRAEYGLSPMELVIQHRIEAAVRYLTRSNMRIDEIADALNYSSTSSFSDLFVRYTGKRPGKFRRDYRARVNRGPVDQW